MLRRWATIAGLALWLSGCAAPFTPVTEKPRLPRGEPVPPPELLLPDAGTDAPVRLPPVDQQRPLANEAPTAPLTQEVPLAPPHAFHWSDRRFSGSYQIGLVAGDPFDRDHTNLPNGLIIAKRYGWDFSDHWGVETRIADGRIAGSSRLAPGIEQTERMLLWDLDLLYYPLGDTRIRPYLTAGAGIADFGFVNQNLDRVHRVVADLPMGVGVKYPINDWLVVRAELLDNLAIGGSGLPTMQNVSLTGGAEIRFGDLRKHFFFWQRDKTAAATTH